MLDLRTTPSHGPPARGSGSWTGVVGELALLPVLILGLGPLLPAIGLMYFTQWFHEKTSCTPAERRRVALTLKGSSARRMAG